MPGVSRALDGVPHADLNNYLYSVLSFLSGIFETWIVQKIAHQGFFLWD